MRRRGTYCFEIREGSRTREEFDSIGIKVWEEKMSCKASRHVQLQGKGKSNTATSLRGGKLPRKTL